MSWDWLGHAAIVFAVSVLLCIPGALLFWRWTIGRVPGIIGFVVGLILTRVFIYLLLNASGIIRTASWLIRNRLISISTIVVVVAAVVALWFVAKRYHWHEAENTLARIVAAVFGVVGGVTIMAVVIIGLFWARRYQGPVGVNTTVPAINIDVGPYVALGDSYSAGEGLAPYLPGSSAREDNCHRSHRAYSQQLHPLSASMAFRACSGAVAADVFTVAQNPRFGVQLSPGVLSASTGLVTLTMGGNDAHFADVLAFCGEKRHCLGVDYDPSRTGDSGADVAPKQPLRSWAHAMVAIVASRLDALYSKLRADAPNARIVVIGYPKLLPTGDIPSQFDGCDIVLQAFDSSERKGISELEDALNTAIFAAARNARIEYIDPTELFASHEACGVRGELVNDVKVRVFHGKNIVAVDRGAFHPRKEGQLVLARELACYLNQYPKAPELHDGSAAPGTSDNPIECG